MSLEESIADVLDTASGVSVFLVVVDIRRVTVPPAEIEGLATAGIATAEVDWAREAVPESGARVVAGTVFAELDWMDDSLGFVVGPERLDGAGVFAARVASTEDDGLEDPGTGIGTRVVELSVVVTAPTKLGVGVPSATEIPLVLPSVAAADVRFGPDVDDKLETANALFSDVLCIV